MRENTLRKSMVLGVIILFVGASIVPSMSGNIGNNYNNPCRNLNRNKGPFDIESKGSNVEQETITDPTDDVMHWYFNGSEWGWECNVADKPNIDVTEISYTISGNQLILTLKVAGTIQSSESVAYYEYLTTSDSVYYICWVEGEGIGMAFNEDEEIYDFDPEVTVSGNTLSCIFDIVGEDYSDIELWGYAAEYVESGDMTSEWWGDWAPDEYAPDGGDGEEEIIEDPFGDVFVYASEDLENLTTTDEKPNIDIKKITYAKNTGSTEVTLTIEVYGEIEDKGNLESGDVSSLNLVLYELSLSTSQDSYKISYINQTCQLSYSNYTVVNITNFSIDGGNLTIQFDVLNASETYEEILANTFELVVFSGWDFCGYFDYVPDPPMAVVIDGGPYEGGTGDDIEFSGVAYFGIPPYTYEWDFGDGETATGGTSVHSYEAAGNYAVTLTVTDDAGSTANATTTAMITEKDTIPPSIQFTSPERALYIGNKKVISFLTTIIVGSINIEVQASDYESGIDCVEFYIDNELKKTDNLAPYSWMWNEYTPFRFRHTIKAVAYDIEGNSAVKEVNVWKFFSAGLKNKKTTFYFKDVLNFEETEHDSMFGMSTLVSESHPTKRVDSKYPPSLFKIDTSRILPRYNLNSDELIYWFAAWVMQLMGSEYGDLLEGFDILLPHPFRIVEAYEYDGNESVEIKGDVVFDLYFLSEMTSKLDMNKDEVKVCLYSINSGSLIPLPKEIKNTTVQITPKLLPRSIHEQEIILKNVNYTLDSGDCLLFSIEIIPGDKALVDIVLKVIELPFFESIVEKVLDFFENQENNSKMPRLQELGALIKEFRSMIEDGEVNITKEQVSEIFTAVMSSSFVYDSTSHSSSVTLPFRFPQDTNIRETMNRTSDGESSIQDVEFYIDNR